MNDRLAARVGGALMITAAVASNAAFAVLAGVFDYPDVLREPAAQILARFTADRSAIIAGFLVLAAAAASLIPVAVILGRLAGRDTVLPRLAATVGVLAGLVQLLGLLRWAYAVPVLADAAADPETAAAAVTAFQVLHQYLGVAVGETLGYLGTAAWTLLVISTVAVPRWTRWVGAVAAVAIAAGVLEPAGIAAAGTANFAGYILWSGWLIATGAHVIRRAARP